jgi:hypothetical protein
MDNERTRMIKSCLWISKPFCFNYNERSAMVANMPM